ncbi:unnamed protein product [Pieris macdunnoughi]|uniref:Uncharacterized protein n=1 Tax=Pieris macdunnoughi TaxID=345717 RepID=A0A821UIQ2_9NEOP|nr:unnamed protein product [Pieris macdunnoughi]
MSIVRGQMKNQLNSYSSSSEDEQLQLEGESDYRIEQGQDYFHPTELIEVDPSNKTHRLRPELEKKEENLGIEVQKMLVHVEIRNNEKLKSDLRPENKDLGIEVRKMLEQVEIRNNEKLKSDLRPENKDLGLSSKNVGTR